MLARCAGPERRNAIVDMLYTRQSAWAFGDKPLEALAALVKVAGVSQADFDACLKDQALYDQVNQTRQRAADGVQGQRDADVFCQRPGNERRIADRGVRQSA